MDVADGFLYLIIIFEIIGGLVGFGILSIVHAILRWTRNRSINLAILGVGMVLIGVNLTRAEAPGVLVMSLFFSLPLAVLVPLAIPPIRDEAIVSLSRIIPCYVVVWAVGAALPFVLVGSGLSNIPFIFWHTPLSNTLVYALVMLTYIVLAAAVYRLMKMHSHSVDHQ